MEKGSKILYQKMIVDKRGTSPGNWLMFSVHDFKRNLFKYKRFDRAGGYAFFPLYLEKSKHSTTFGINLIWINLELTKHRG